MFDDDLDFHYASDADWDNADAWERGMQNSESAWILTSRDVWHPNPFYCGPQVPHPEDYQDYS